MNNSIEYFNYFKKKSFLGNLYRKFYLYPFLCKYLNGKTLDIGSGLGNFIKYRNNTIGVDVNPLFVKYCTDRGLNVSLMLNDKIDFDDSSFDSALLDNVLEHVQSPCFLLADIFRILKPNSYLLVGVPGRKGWLSDSDHKVFYDESLLINTVVKEGFTFVRFFYMPLFKSNFLSLHLKQYCLFGLFLKH